MMDYKEYKEFMMNNLQQRFGDSVEISIVEVNRRNDTKREAMMLKSAGLSPVIYLDGLYEEYQQKKDPYNGVDWCISKFAGTESAEGWNISLDWEDIRPRIKIRLMGKERNREYLQDKIYVEMMDLAAVLTIILKYDEEGEASMPIPIWLPEACGYDRAAFEEAAWENLRKEKFTIQSIEKVLMELFAEDLEEEDMLEEIPDTGIYVMTNEWRLFGARAMCRKDMLGAFAEEIGRNLYIIPCSMHELILVKDDGSAPADEIKEIVQDVNGNSGVIGAEEILSDSVYYFDRKTGEIRIVA